MAAPYVPLRIFSCYSMLEGAIDPKAIAKQARRLDFPAAAVTDTHALLFHAAGGGTLGSKAKAHFAAAERRDALVYVPAAVIGPAGSMIDQARRIP